MQSPQARVTRECCLASVIRTRVNIAVMKRFDLYLDRIPLLNPPPLAGEEIGGGMKGGHITALRWEWRVAIVAPFILPHARMPKVWVTASSGQFRTRLDSR
jgi:hypothetical protein